MERSAFTFTIFQQVKQVLELNNEPRERWARVVPLQLSGEASQAYSTVVTLDVIDVYKEVKLQVLYALGDTPHAANQKWWSMKIQPGESYAAHQPEETRTL